MDGVLIGSSSARTTPSLPHEEVEYIVTVVIMNERRSTYKYKEIVRKDERRALRVRKGPGHS